MEDARRKAGAGEEREECKYNEWKRNEERGSGGRMRDTVLNRAGKISKGMKRERKVSRESKEEIFEKGRRE